MSQTNSSIRPDVVSIGAQALSDLYDYLATQGLNKLVLIADANTYAALGERLEAQLRALDADVIPVVYMSEEVVADAAHVLEALVRTDREPRTYLAVGSGTITDITRFVSWRTGNRFISVPTAPSVDGFASLGAPLIIQGVKTTLLTQSPRAIFADLDTLAAAPQEMIAAGFADVLGKYTSVADWRIGRLLWDEPYDEEIAVRTLDTARKADARAALIGEGSPEGVRVLMESLIESGFCMLDFGSSRNASGAEHHYSHYWEMQLLREGRPAILHGAKVGVATILVAQLYDLLKRLTREEVADLLEDSRLPALKDEIATIQDAYGDLAPPIIADQAPFLNCSERRYDEVKRRILDNWNEIRAIAEQVPTADHIARTLELVGGPTTVAHLGLTKEEQYGAEQYGHYLRQRFTVRKLMRVLTLE